MDMIEKIAKAMCEANGTIWGGPRGEDDPDFLLVKLSYMRMARAAIEAMREPTEAMLKAGDLPGWDDSVSIGLSGEVWQAMIDAALPSPPVAEETK